MVLSLCTTFVVGSFNLFLLAMAFVGFFAAAVPAAMFAYTAKTSHPEKVARAMGVMISASVVGIIAGRSFVGVMTKHVTWEYAFLIYAVITGTVVLLSCLLPNEKTSVNNVPILSLYSSALRLFFNKKTVALFFVGFFLFSSYLGVSSFMTYALKQPPLNLSSESLSWLNLVGISAVVGATLSSKLCEFFSQKKLSIIFLVGVLAAITLIGHSHSLIGVGLGILSLFIVVFAIQPIILSALNRLAPVGQKGSVSSLYLLSCLAGGGIGTSALGSVWSSYGWSGVIAACQITTLIALALLVKNRSI